MASKISIGYLSDGGVVSGEYTFVRGASGSSSLKTTLTKNVGRSLFGYPIVYRVAKKRFFLSYNFAFDKAPLIDFTSFMGLVDGVSNGDEHLMRVTDWTGVRSSGYITSISDVAPSFNGERYNFSFGFTVKDYNI